MDLLWFRGGSHTRPQRERWWATPCDPSSGRLRSCRYCVTSWSATFSLKGRRTACIKVAANRRRLRFARAVNAKRPLLPLREKVAEPPALRLDAMLAREVG